MLDSPRPASLAPWATAVIAVVGAIYGYGVQSSRIDSLERQVAQMSADARDNAKMLTGIQLDVIEIKTKLNVLVPTPAPKREQQ